VRCGGVVWCGSGESEYKTKRYKDMHLFAFCKILFFLVAEKEKKKKRREGL
jgi:hypothetical protein